MYIGPGRRCRSHRGASPNGRWSARKVHRDTMGRECGRTQATGPNKNARRWAIWLRAKETPDKDAVLYLIAKGGEPTVNKGSGDNPPIALLTVLGGKPPQRVVVNEFTTVASVWTNAQFLDGAALQGHALGLRI